MPPLGSTRNDASAEAIRIRHALAIGGIYFTPKTASVKVRRASFRYGRPDAAIQGLELDGKIVFSVIWVTKAI